MSKIVDLGLSFYFMLKKTGKFLFVLKTFFSRFDEMKTRT